MRNFRLFIFFVLIVKNFLFSQSFAQPDLVIRNLYYQSNKVVAGNVFSISYKHYNYGNTPVVPSITGYFLSTDSIWDVSDQLLGTINVGTININQSLSSSSSLSIPSACSENSYYLLIVADYLNTIGEISDVNNTALLTIDIVLPEIDFEIRNHTITPAETKPGSIATASIAIVNRSNTVVKNLAVGYYLSVDTKKDASDLYLGDVVCPSMNVNESYYKAKEVQIPTNTPEGNYYLLFYIDYQNMITEVNDSNNIAYLPISIKNQYHQIRLETVTSNETKIFTGNSLSVNIGLLNEGNYSENFSVGVYLSIDSIFDVSDSYIGTSDMSLSAKSSNNIGISTTIPILTNSGKYYLLFYADNNSLIPELNENDNIKNLAISVVSPEVDLVTSYVSLANNSTISGVSISITVRNINQGNSSASSSLLGYYLSVDSIFDPSDIYLDNTTMTSINAGSYYSIFDDVNIPFYVLPGSYFIICKADYSNVIIESDETNNTYFVPITILNSYTDLTIVNIQNQKHSLSGAQTKITTKIFNSGTKSSNSNYCGYYLSIDTILDVSDIFLGHQTIPSIASLSKNEQSTTLNLPMLSSGKYYIFCFADYINSIHENNESNNIEIDTIYIVEHSGVSYTIPMNSIDSITACEGNIFDNGGKDNNYKSSSNGKLLIKPDVEGNKIGIRFSSFSTNSSDYLRIYDGPSTTYPLLGEFSGTNVPNELYSSDVSGSLLLHFVSSYTNYSGFSATVSCNTSIPPADLVFEDKSIYLVSSSIIKNTNINTSIIIENIGASAASSSNIACYLSSDSVFDAADVMIGTLTGSVISSNSRFNRSINIIIPDTIPPGNYQMIYVADYTNTVVEAFENNNYSIVSINVKENVVDLASLYNSINVDSIAADGKVSYVYYAFNKGNTNLSSTKLGFYLSVDSFYSADDTYLTYASIGALNVGISVKYTGNLTIPSSIMAGTYYLLFYADYNNSIIEDDKTNNVVCNKIIILPQSFDLEILNVCLSRQFLTAGESVIINYYLLNRGNITAPLNYSGFYISTDNLWDASDIFLNQQTSSTNIASNSIYAKTFSLTIPLGLPAGDYFLLLYSDNNNTINETNESNNITSIAIKIIDKSVDLCFSLPCVNGNNFVAGGSSKEIYGTIYNNGYSSSGGFISGIYLSTDSLWSNEDILFKNEIINSISAKNYFSITSTISIPDTIIPGVYYLINKVDNANVISETDESNNTGFIKINVIAKKLDFCLLHSSLEKNTFIKNESFSNSYFFYNKSNYASPLIYYAYYLSLDSIFDGTDFMISSSSLSPQNEGITSYYTKTLTIPATALPGNYYLIQILDYQNLHLESDENNNISVMPITVLTSYVDLLTTAPTAPASVYAGNNALLSCYIQNNGNISSSSSNIGVYLSSNNIIDSLDILLGTISGNTIGADAVLSKSGNFTIPFNTIPGTYYILFYADYLKNVSEADETNNVSSKIITINSGTIDLYVSSTSTGYSIYAGNTISVSYTYGNSGNSKSLPCNIGFYLSDNSSYDASDVLLGSQNGSTLTSGTTESRSYSLKIPQNVTTGNYYIITIADNTNVVPEISESNNSKYSSITIYSAAIDLDISVPINSYTAVPGGTVNIAYTVSNLGTSATSESNTAFYLSYDDALDSSDSLLSINNGGILNGGSSSLRNYTISIPSDVPPDNYYLLLYIDYADVIEEISEMNNLNIIPLSVETRNIDLVILSQASSDSMYAGSVFLVSCYISNIGNFLSPDKSVGYYLSKDNVLDPSDMLIGESSGLNLSGGNQYYYNTYLTMPVSVLPDNYYVFYKADFNSSVNEINELNNTAYYPIKVLPSNIDLKLNTPICPITTPNGSSISLSCNIENIGTTPSPLSGLGYYLSNDSILDISDRFLGEMKGGQLFSSSSVNRTILVNIPENTASGNYYIIYFADYNELVPEINEINNVIYSPINVTSNTLDLVIETPSSPEFEKVGNTISVSCFIKNNGNISSLFSNVGYFLSIDDVFSIDDIFLGRSEAGKIDSSSSSYRFSELLIPQNIIAGNYYLLYFADFNNQVTEVNEINNTTNVPITILASEIDLAITNPSGPISVVSGDTVNFSCYFKNYGSSYFSNSNVSYYLSLDTLFSDEDLHLRNSANFSLNSGASLYVLTGIPIPVGYVSDNYYLLYVVDKENKVNELNEDNNIEYLSISIHIPSVDLSLSTPANPAIANAGDPIDVSCNIKNTGLNNASSSNVGVYLSEDETLDMSDYFLGFVTGGVLRSDSISLRKNTVIVPSSIKSGNYYIIYVADFNFVVDEESEVNNTNLGVITILPSQIDLTISSPSAPTIVYAGININVSCIISNNGLSTASSSSMAYYLSSDIKYDSMDIALASQLGTSIKPGESSSRNITFGVPPTVAAGTYFILYIADPNKSVAEVNEDNNIAFSSITINEPQIDLLIASTTCPFIAASKSSINTSCMLFNSGISMSLISSVGIFLSIDNVLDSSDILLSNNPYSNLLGGSSINCINFIKLPEISSGIYSLIFAADYKNTIKETDETNNISFLSISITEPEVDFKIHEISLPDNIVAGEVIGISSSILNQGISASELCTLGFYLSSDMNLSNNDILLSVSDNINIEANGKKSKYNYIKIPDTIPTAFYYIIIKADFNDIIIETDESNNILSRQVMISQPILDLLVTSLNLPNDSLRKGTSFSLQYILKNNGIESANNVKVGYYIVSDSNLTPFSRLIDYSVYPLIKPKESMYVNTSISVPYDIQSGRMTLIVLADYNNNIIENSELNNSISNEVFIPQAFPDLTVTGPSTIIKTYQGSQTPFECRLKNIGDTLIDNAKLNYYLSEDIILDSVDTKLGNSNFIGKILPNETEQIILYLSVDDSIHEGNYFLIIDSKLEQDLPELDYSNNIVSLPVVVYKRNNIQTQQISIVNLYPNPADEYFNITISSKEVLCKIEIADMTGRTIKLIEGEDLLINDFRIDVKDLMPGVYIISIINEKYKVSKQLIVH